ncbi:MAG: hypothetical protein OQK24_04940 [Magnetovibrio sp.]|nr:hypothetical protein [Magnetovibrio sp.]
MAQILNFQPFHTAKKFRVYTQQTSHIILGVDVLKKRFTHIDATVAEIKAKHIAFYEKLDAHQKALQHTLKHAQKCSRAWGLNTVEEMVEARNKILQDH